MDSRTEEKDVKKRFTLETQLVRCALERERGYDFTGPAWGGLPSTDDVMRIMGWFNAYAKYFPMDEETSLSFETLTLAHDFCEIVEAWAQRWIAYYAQRLMEKDMADFAKRGVDPYNV